ncbi:hypothetical protein [Falsiroseomonas sp. CW058]|uniref:hypothetical protein n=1 Tax=Falsiroseomonas sp. CW058 TaxID=3388664 RepID=UPI003D3212C1
MRLPFVPWWRLRALPGLAWRAFREDRVFRVAALGAVLALLFLLGRLSETPGTAGPPQPAWEAPGVPQAGSPAFPERPPVPPPGSLPGGASTPSGAVLRIDPGQPLDAAPRSTPGDRFGTVAPQPPNPGPRP